MKVLTIALLLISGQIYGQNYMPFPDSGAIWVNTIEEFQYFPVTHCEFMYATNYCMNGEDTMINSNNYTKLRICEIGTYEGAIRDSSGKVFFVPVDSTTEVLLYDFTLDSGDTVYEGTWGTPWDIEVFGVDSILIYGQYHKRVHVDLGVWVEGIGNTATGLLGTNVGVLNYCFKLNCFSVNDSTKFPNEVLESCYLGVGLDQQEEFNFNIYPNPNNSGKLTVEHSSISPIDYHLIDIQGKIIQEGILLENQISLPQDQGIYILKLQGSFGIKTERLVVK